jgi:hypothetical protein
MVSLDLMLMLEFQNETIYVIYSQITLGMGFCD